MPIKNKRKLRFVLLFVMLATALFACSDEEHMRDLTNYIDALKKTVTKHQKRNFIADLALPVPVTFQSSESARDPFEDEQVLYGGGSLNNPLTAFPIKEYEFEGTIVRDNQIWAVVMAPDNKIYQVSIKDRFGNHYGRIIEISSDQIKVEEAVPEQEVGGSGHGLIKRIVTLQIKGGD